MWLKRPKLQLSIAWIIGIIISIALIRLGIGERGYIRGSGYALSRYYVKDWFNVLIIPLVIIGTLMIATLQVIPHIFRSMLHKIKAKKSLKAVEKTKTNHNRKKKIEQIGFILACVFVGLLILFLIAQKIETQRSYTPTSKEMGNAIEWLRRHQK